MYQPIEPLIGTHAQADMILLLHWEWGDLTLKQNCQDAFLQRVCVT